MLLGIILFWCVVWALIGPLISPWIEKRLEWFILGVGLLAATLSWSWSEVLIVEALMRPLKVCGAILAGSLLFSFSHDNLTAGVQRLVKKTGLRPAVGVSVLLVGVAASFLTTVVAVLVLVELLGAMRLERKAEVAVAVLGCFAIGLGGGVTPIAGPVPAIVMAKLAGAPYAVGTSYLVLLIGPWILPPILSLAIVAGLLFAQPAPGQYRPPEEDPLSLWTILLLTGKMYVFIAGLVLLGGGLVPLIDRFLIGASPWLLYWINSVSAVIDGATLASVEISPLMTQAQIRYILIGLLIAGGALVTGNAPNLVAAHKLKIPHREWARVGLPIGALLMVFYFLSLVVWS